MRYQEEIVMVNLDFDTLREFFGWCSVINVGLLTLTGVFVFLLRKPISRIHGKMFGLDETSLSSAYFQYLAQYKILVIVFNIVPYIVLKIMC